MNVVIWRKIMSKCVYITVVDDGKLVSQTLRDKTHKEGNIRWPPEQNSSYLAQTYIPVLSNFIHYRKHRAGYHILLSFNSFPFFFWKKEPTAFSHNNTQLGVLNKKCDIYFEKKKPLIYIINNWNLRNNFRFF